MSSIATRTGDDGTTSLLYGQRVPKDHPQIEAVGAFDELNVALGAVKPHLGAADAPLRELIHALQQNLVALMGELACAESDAARYAASKFTKLTAADTARIDAGVAALEAKGLKFDGWATPGANARAAALETARVTDDATIKGAAQVFGSGVVSADAVLDGDSVTGADISNGFQFGWAWGGQAPEVIASRTAPASLFSSYEFSSTHAYAAKDKYGVTDALLVGSMLGALAVMLWAA